MNEREEISILFPSDKIPPKQKYGISIGSFIFSEYNSKWLPLFLGLQLAFSPKIIPDMV